MSSGYSGSSTRAMGKFEREIETRSKKLDVFRDDFDSPSDAFKESDVVDSIKKSGPYGKKHDDTIPEADPRFGRLAAAGKPEDQEPMDALDEQEQRYQSRIKDKADQFPMKKSGGIMGPDEFQKRCAAKEKEMSKLGKTSIGQVLGNLEYLAKQHALTIESVDSHHMTVTAPYAGQLAEFARRAKAIKGVERVTESSTGKTKKSTDGHEYPIGKVMVILADDIDR